MFTSTAFWARGRVDGGCVQRGDCGTASTGYRFLDIGDFDRLHLVRQDISGFHVGSAVKGGVVKASGNAALFVFNCTMSNNDVYTARVRVACHCRSERRTAAPIVYHRRGLRLRTGRYRAAISLSPHEGGEAGRPISDAADVSWSVRAHIFY